MLNDVYGKSTSHNANNKQTETSNRSNSSFGDSADLSSLFQAFFQNANQNSNQNTNQNSTQDNSQSSNNFNMSDMPDIETILKFKKVFERFQSKNGSNDPIANLLYAIKPFMQESKKSIIDQIVKFITISSVLQDFNGLF